MGLDIYHEKATFKQPDKKDYHLYNCEVITEEKFEGFNVPFTYFERYIQTVEYAEPILTVLVIKSEDSIPTLRALFEGEELIFLHHPDEQAQEAIAALEKKAGLTKLIPEARQGFDWKSFRYYDFVWQKGFYVEEVGYQRKGVNEKFWKRFSSENIYNFALIEDFEYAYSCVDKYWPSDTKADVLERKQKFKEDFLGKYEPGASYLGLSY